MNSNSNTNSDIRKPVIVLGAGKHAKVLIEALRQSGRNIMGLTAPDKVMGEECYGTVVLSGDDDAIFKVSPDQVELVNGIGAMSQKDLRYKLTERMEAEGYSFAQVIHPSAVIADDAILGLGVQIMAGVIIQPGAKIGRSCIINTGVIVDHDCEINDDCHLAPGVILSGGVIVGKGTHLGTGASVIDRIVIGEGSIIAAGSVIHKNVASRTKYIQLKKELLIKKGF